ERDNREEAQIQLDDGELLIFGKEKNKGIALDGLTPKVVSFEAGDEQAAIDAGVIKYNKNDINLARIIAELDYPEFPVPMGVFYQPQRPIDNGLVAGQNIAATEKRTVAKDVNGRLEVLSNDGDTWVVE